MRRRRAERCCLRAEAAIEAGFFEEAREALDEARRLQPDLPGLSAADEHLAAAERAPLEPAVPGRRPLGVRALTAAASLAAAAGFAGWLLSGEPASPPSSGERSAPAAASAGSLDRFRTAATTGAPPAVPPPEAVAASAPDNPDQPVAGDGQVTPQAPLPVPDAAVEPEPAQPIVTAIPLIEVPPPAPAAAREREPAATLPAVSSSDVPSAPPASATPALPPPSTPLPSSAPASSPPDANAGPRAEAQEADVEAQVRAALSRYEAAYSALDAAAARSVWPTVDAAALGRAFNSLQSQRVSLGNCSVSVGANRQVARADCAGIATWTPKVGGGTHSQSRRWTFDLELSGDRWRILRAMTR